MQVLALASYTFRTDFLFMQSEHMAKKLLEFLYIVQQSKVCESIINICILHYKLNTKLHTYVPPFTCCMIM